MSSASGQKAEIREEHVRIGGFMTRCLTAGPEDAETVFLLHDGAWGGCSSVSWGEVIPALAEDFRVIAPDMLGFGGTDKVVFLDQSPHDFRIRHLVAVLDHFGVKRKVHVVGSSFGGSVALQMIPLHADRLASVTSICAAGGGWRTEFGRAILGRWDGSEDGLKTVLDVLVDRRPGFDYDAQLSERLHWGRQNGHYRALMAPSLALPELLASKREHDPSWPAKLGDFPVPILLIAGARDQLIEAGWAERLAAFCTDCEVELLDARHSPNIDDAANFTALLRSWLARRSAA